MNRQIVLWIFGLFSVLVLASCQQPEKLFEEDTENWSTEGNVDWFFDGHELVGQATEEGGYVVSKETYSDFVLELEFKPDSAINTGVFIRCKNKDLSPANCYELNIWDLHPDKDNRTGAIVAKQVPLAYVETLDQWNTFKVKAVKNHLQVWINGTLTIDAKHSDYSEGYIGLQAKIGGEVRFRNVRVKRLQ